MRCKLFLVGNLLLASLTFNGVRSLAKSLDVVNSLQSTEFQRAVNLYNTKRFKDAAAIFEQLVSNKQATPLTWLYLAHARYAIGNRTGAVYGYRVLQKSFPGTAETGQAELCLQKIENEASFESGKMATPAAQKNTSSELSKSVEIVPPKFGHTPVTAVNAKAIKDAVMNFPPKVRKVLNENGVGFSIAPTMEEQFPVFLRQEREGFPGYTNGTVGGLFDVNTNKICIFQSKFDESTHQPLEVRTAEDLVGTFLHESGHAIDAYLGNYSQSEQYRIAFYRDIDEMPGNINLKIKSFAQKTAFSQKESCAELTSVLLGGVRPNAEELKDYLSNTVKVVKLHLGI